MFRSLFLQQEISAIPDENLIEPPLSIVGPALNSAQYHIEEEVLRKMFSKIISSSMDNRKSSRAHHSFVEIIKQPSPLDASNLKVFQQRFKLPVVSYGIEAIINHIQGTLKLYPHVFPHNPDCDDSIINASSLNNLQRLGLISIEYSGGLLDKSLYNNFEKYELINKITNRINSGEFFNTETSQDDGNKIEDISTLINKGSAELAPLGKDFYIPVYNRIFFISRNVVIFIFSISRIYCSSVSSNSSINLSNDNYSHPIA